ncbi:hypothetical protein AURDEDRAFT_129072 [Auricularia subglabra TFB-10046 SS5]|uniref:Uncharacterized protein n=1 Tax=Auricularia subglabra (strain TFB-10046 / SS5) TaxID=717982 RepID=J0WWZ7_AURST|nr:hypothetical protein AURDEDRAFT_129072 [Auricularia subglabra TFB-10046 SS5]
MFQHFLSGGAARLQDKKQSGSLRRKRLYIDSNGRYMFQYKFVHEESETDEASFGELRRAPATHDRGRARHHPQATIGTGEALVGGVLKNEGARFPRCGSRPDVASAHLARCVHERDDEGANRLQTRHLLLPALGITEAVVEIDLGRARVDDSESPMARVLNWDQDNLLVPKRGINDRLQDGHDLPEVLPAGKCARREHRDAIATGGVRAELVIERGESCVHNLRLEMEGMAEAVER